MVFFTARANDASHRRAPLSSAEASMIRESARKIRIESLRSKTPVGSNPPRAAIARETSFVSSRDCHGLADAASDSMVTGSPHETRAHLGRLTALRTASAGTNIVFFAAPRLTSSTFTKRSWDHDPNDSSITVPVQNSSRPDRSKLEMQKLLVLPN